jgi:chromosome segregation ATPase
VGVILTPEVEDKRAQVHDLEEYLVRLDADLADARHELHRCRAELATLLDLQHRVTVEPAQRDSPVRELAGLVNWMVGRAGPVT